MIHKLTKSPFKDVTLNQYQDNSSLFTKALKRRPSKQYDMPISAPFVPTISPQAMKKSPLSPITKGLVMPKIDYTCDQQLVTNKRQDDFGLLCRQTLNRNSNNNDNSLFCHEELSLAPTQKTQVKYKAAPSNNDQMYQGFGLGNYVQVPLIQPSVAPVPSSSPIQVEYKMILEKTSKILEAYEIDKRKRESQRLQLEFENQKLKEKLYHYQKMAMHRG